MSLRYSSTGFGFSSAGGPSGGNRKGQASMEYLLLSLVGIALISFSLMSLSDIKSFMDREIGISRFRDSALSLHDAISEVCAAGSGNQRAIILSVPVNLTSEPSDAGILAVYSRGDDSIVMRTRCPVDAAALEGRIIVENEEGEIRLR